MDSEDFSANDGVVIQVESPNTKRGTAAFLWVMITLFTQLIQWAVMFHFMVERK
jgi:hypothetical protein